MNIEKVQQTQQFTEYKKAIQAKFNGRKVDFESVARTTKRAFETAKSLPPTFELSSEAFTRHYYRYETLFTQYNIPKEASLAFCKLYNNTNNRSNDFKHFLDNQLPLLNQDDVDGIKELAKIYAEKYNYPIDDKMDNVFDVIHSEGNSWANKVAELQKKVSQELDNTEEAWEKILGFIVLSALALWIGTFHYAYQTFEGEARDLTNLLGFPTIIFLAYAAFILLIASALHA